MWSSQVLLLKVRPKSAPPPHSCQNSVPWMWQTCQAYQNERAPAWLSYKWREQELYLSALCANKRFLWWEKVPDSHERGPSRHQTPQVYSGLRQCCFCWQFKSQRPHQSSSPWNQEKFQQVVSIEKFGNVANLSNQHVTKCTYNCYSIKEIKNLIC